jgi:hypothetical protein
VRGNNEKKEESFALDIFFFSEAREGAVGLSERIEIKSFMIFSSLIWGLKNFNIRFLSLFFLSFLSFFPISKAQSKLYLKFIFDHRILIYPFLVTKL